MTPHPAVTAALPLPAFPLKPFIQTLPKIPPQLHKHPVRGVKTQLQHGLWVLLVLFMLSHPASGIAAPLLEHPGLLPPVKTAAGTFPKILQA